MKIALATGVLFVPPVYFTLSHAEKLRAENEFCMFTLLARVTDPEVLTPVESAVPLSFLPVGVRQAIIPFVLPRLASRIRQFHPDLVHQHFATWSTPAITAAARSSVPLITTVHGYDVFATLRQPQTMMERWHHRNVSLAQRHSTRVLAVSEYLAGKAVEGGFDPSRLAVHYQGVDTEFFTPGGQRQGPGAFDEPVVLFVGALSQLKGVRDLVQASAALVKTTPHRVVLIGEGPLEKELRAAAAIMPHMQLTGRLDRREVREWMRRSTVMVLPTQEDRGRREAAGLVLLEAQACGTPVVTYDSGGTSEMIDAGSSGLLVPEKDVAALQAAIGSVLSLDGAGYEQMRRAARHFVETKRSLAASCVELEQHYEAVVGR